MNVAVIKDGVCNNVAVFESLLTAEQFLSMGIWPDADTVAELPDGYGIGDSYDGEAWTKAPQPEPPEPPEPPDPPIGGEDQEAINEFVRGMMMEWDTLEGNDE